jgi:hypothetical protein
MLRVVQLRQRANTGAAWLSGPCPGESHEQGMALARCPSVRWQQDACSLTLIEMKLTQLFRRDRTIIKRADAQDQAEKLLAESLRLLSQVCTKVADLIETQRLERAGYSNNAYLRRLDNQQPGDAERKKE